MILELTLLRQYFIEILLGIKKIEYREIKEYWNKRLLGKQYKAIRFKNGYSRNVPEMIIEYKGYTINENDNCFELHLGNILETKNCEILQDLQFEVISDNQIALF